MATKNKKFRNVFLEVFGQILITISILCAIIFGVESAAIEDASNITFFAATAKSVAIATLAIFAMINATRLDIAGLAIALTINAIGDIFAISAIVNAVKFSLYAFVASHVVYFIIFAANMAPLSEMTSLRMRIIATLWGIAGVAGFWFWPEFSPKFYLFFGYSIILMLMTTAALMSRFPVILVGVGALLLFISDVIMGLGYLSDYVRNSVTSAWPTFYLAQLLITLGIVLTPKSEKLVRRRYKFN